MALRKPNVSNTVNARSSYKSNLFSSGRIILAVLQPHTYSWEISLGRCKNLRRRRDVHN